MRWWVCLPALALGALAPASASAYCRTTTCRGEACTRDADGCPADGKPLFWATSCIGFSVDARLSANLPTAPTRKAIEKAFQAWADLDCPTGRASLTFSPLADTTCRKIGYVKEGANVHVVTFRDDDWTYKGVDNTLAKTTVTFDVATGEILDADIEVNTATNPVTVGDTGVKFDLQSLLTHEVGHLVGLAHSPDFDATMYASYETGSTRIRALSPDDKAALCAVYPPGRAARCDAAPRGGLATSCDDPPEGGCAAGAPRGQAGFGLHWGSLLLLAPLALRAARGRRRRPSDHP